MSEQKDKTIEMLRNVLTGLLYLIAAWQYNVNTKLEERIYAMQTSAMTVAAAQQMEDRIGRNIDTRFGDLSNRLDLILRLIQSQQGGGR